MPLLPILPEKGKRGLLIVLVVILALAACSLAWKVFFYKAPVTGVFAPAKPADGMSDVPTHTTKPVPLQAYDKAKAIKVMGIPEIMLSDPKLELVATSKTSKDRQGYITTSAAITDTTTGKTTIIEKKERSLFSFGGATELGLRAGIGTAGQTGGVYARQDLARVGNVYLAGYGEAAMSVTRPAEAKAMVDISWRW